MVPGICLPLLWSRAEKVGTLVDMVCMMSFSVIVFQWYFWGYSLAFSSRAKSGFIGEPRHFGWSNTLGVPSPVSPLIPKLLYAFFQASTR